MSMSALVSKLRPESGVKIFELKRAGKVLVGLKARRRLEGEGQVKFCKRHFSST